MDKKFTKFINRELSWLEFNSRVLEEAFEETGNPILERAKFLSIFSSNLDEFFMVRVSSLYDKIMAGINEKDNSGLAPKELVKLISKKATELVNEQYKCFSKSLTTALIQHGIKIVKPEELDSIQKDYIDRYYRNTIFPVITPTVVDNSRSFPLIHNRSLNIGILLDGGDVDEDGNPEYVFGTVQIPSVLDRLVRIPDSNSNLSFIFLEDIIKMNLETLFSSYRIVTYSCYRITRNTDQDIDDEEEAEDLLHAIQEYIKKRKWGVVIRIEIEHGIDEKLYRTLIDEFEVKIDFVFRIKGPIDLTCLNQLVNLSGYENLKFKIYRPKILKDFHEKEDIFEIISEKDILLHHPYHSFDPVIEFVEKASEDPKVLAIKQTLYRVSGNSPIVAALMKAAENGKQVTVLVELKARFDEEKNIKWAMQLEKAGCHVIYGLVGLKTHCKILLVVRMEEEGIKRYVHLSTGNYNDITAKIYTDLGFFTSNPFFGADASALFNRLTGYSKLDTLYKFTVAPDNMRQKFVSLIRREIEHVKKGGKGKIIAKMNALVDEGIIKELYNASNNNVEIELIVRGICCLRPGVKGLSENISVRSIVGKYLEHSRIYYFYNGGEEEIYLSSADWMTRNIDRRVEIMFPIEQRDIFDKLKKVLEIYLKDNIKARILRKDGVYSKMQLKKKDKINAQQFFENMSTYL